MKEDMVSVIVPVYNTEKYLRRCLNSIIGQTYHDIEIILIDDGSKDFSGQICDEYAANDSRIQVVHQQNKGLALSRLRAISLAQGNYVQFVDSDDWIELDMVEKLMNKALEERSDVVWCDLTIHDSNNHVFNISFNPNPSDMLRAVYEDKVPAWLVNKLYNADILKNLEIPIVDMMEDMFYITQVLCRNPKMSYIAESLYHYDQTNTFALTKIHNFHIKGIPNLLLCYEYLKKKNVLGMYCSSLYNRILKEKVRLVNLGRYEEAQRVLPVSHKNIKDYPLSFPISLLYWLGFNLHGLGRVIFSFLMRFGRSRRFELENPK